MEQVPTNEGPRRSQRAKKSVISNYYEVYATKEFQMEGEEEFQMEGDPTSFEEAMRSNGVCDLEKIPK
jgi:hypothetical protein